jgi:biopolymer transport protein ExbB/TolQ
MADRTPSKQPSALNSSPASGWIATLGPLMLAGVLSAIFFGTLITLRLPPEYTLVRYTMGHWIEMVEVGFFFWGMAILAYKVLGINLQRKAIDYAWLPKHQSAIPAQKAAEVAEQLSAAPAKLRRTIMGRRLCRAISDVADREASDHLDQYMKDLADEDADEGHASFTLPRTIAWAIPILGFLGTVIGITLASANITPAQLEESLPEVTAGLAVAFDTTALALTLSMGLIFSIFIVERMEQGVLGRVDAASRRLLGNRFLSTSTESAPYLSAVQAASLQVIQHTRTLVDAQTQLWSQTLSQLNERLDQALAKRDQMFTQVMSQFIAEARRDTTAFDTSQKRMEDLQSRLTRLAELLIHRTGEERALIASQDRLAENLRMLRQTQSFDETLHSLTAAVHLLTVRAHQLTSDRSEAKAA